MANGDAAAAAGYDLVPATADKRMGYDEINKTRDYIAQFKTSGTIPFSRVTNRTAAQISTATASNVQADLDFLGDRIDAADAAVAGKASQTGLDSVYLGSMSPAIYARILTTNYRSAYINDAGVLGHVPSSRRFKQNMEPAAIDTATLRAIALKWWRYRREAQNGNDEVHLGPIAEELHDLGLHFVVIYDDEGRPFSIDRDEFAHLALMLAQQAWDALDDLTVRVARLEGNQE